MNKTYTICDNCNKVTPDYMSEVGWVRLDVDHYSVSGGRDKSNVSKTKAYITNAKLDFCCLECLFHWFMEQGRK